MKYLSLGKRIAELREKRGLSLEAFAAKIGSTPEEIEKIESDAHQPLIGVLIKVAKALQVNVADILRDRPQASKFEIIRASERRKIQPLREPAPNAKIFDYTYELLTHPAGDKHLDAYLIEVPPYQSKRPREDITHAGEEFIYLLEGELAGEIGGDSFRLQPGDSLYLRSTQPHVFYNPGGVRTVALTVIYPF